MVFAISTYSQFTVPISTRVFIAMVTMSIGKIISEIASSSQYVIKPCLVLNSVFRLLTHKLLCITCDLKVK